MVELNTVTYMSLSDVGLNINIGDKIVPGSESNSSREVFGFSFNIQ